MGYCPVNWHWRSRKRRRPGMITVTKYEILLDFEEKSPNLAEI